MQWSSLVTVCDLIATFAFATVGARVAASKGIDFAGRLYYGVALQNILWESDFVTGQKKSIKKLSVELAEFVYNSLRK